MLPGSENNVQDSNLFCSESCIGSIYKLNVDYLKYIISQDSDKLQKLWENLVWRLIIIHQEDLKMFASLHQDKVKLFCKICKVKLYKPGELIDMSSGGVLFRGSLS